MTQEPPKRKNPGGRPRVGPTLTIRVKPATYDSIVAAAVEKKVSLSDEARRRIERGSPPQ
jgi:hypothetical protein